MSMNWYENYFGKGTQEVKAYLDCKGRLFLCDIIDGLTLPQNHNCNEMGCGSVGPHIHSVYLDARKHNELQAKNERLTDLFECLRRWTKAYPLKVFPEPDFEKAAEALKAAGLSLDAVSASNMRHVLTQVKDIIEQALQAKEEE